MFEILNAQNHLNKTNLAILFSCDPLGSNSIYISFRKISSIDPATFTGLTCLEYLELHSNQISSIDPSTFKGLISLQCLYLHS
jgi:Leucine-rich repeat (LRR) protein